MSRRKPVFRSKSLTQTVELIERTAIDITRYTPRVTQFHRVGMVWLASKERDITHLTYIRYKAALDRIHAVLGPVEIGDINWPHVEQVVMACRRQGMGPGTIRYEFGVLAMLLEWCARNDIVSEVATRKMRLRDFDLSHWRTSRIKRRMRWLAWPSAPSLKEIARRHQEVLDDRH